MRTRFFRCQIPLMAAFGSIAVPVTLCCTIGSGNLWPFLFAPALYLVLSCLCMLLKGKWRLPAAIPGLVLLWAVSLRLLEAEHPAVRLANPLLYTIMLLCTLPVAGWEQGREPTIVVPASCVIAHLLTQFLQFAKPSPNPAVPWILQGSFVIFFLLMLLSLNRQSMAAAMPEAHTIPASIRSRNRLLTWLLTGMVLLLSLIPALGRLANRLLECVKAIIRAIVNFFLNIFQMQDAGNSGGASEEDMLSGLVTEDASALAKFLEKIMMVVSVILLAIAVVLALRFLWKKLRQFARFVYGQLRHYANTASEDYEDEVVDTRRQGDAHFDLAGRFRRRRNAQRDLKNLPPREQIRTRYGLLRGKHPEWTQSETARETLGYESARLYERARYSSHTITQQDSDSFAEKNAR